MHIVYSGYYIQSAENRRKECHRFLVMLTSRSDSNVQISSSKKINGMVFI